MPDSGALGPFFHGWRLYIDGSAWPNPGRMSLGAMLLGPDDVSHALSRVLPGTGCNNEAELRALIEALPWACQHGAIKPAVYTDSSVLVEQLSPSCARVVTRLQPLLSQARQLMVQHGVADLRWVPRHRNGQADALARHALGLPPKVVVTPHPSRRKR